MMSKSGLIFSILISLFVQNSFAQVWEDSSNSSANQPPVEPIIRNFQESDFKNFPWLNEFTNVIVINKANQGLDQQTLKLYVKGQLKLITKVSTGRERFEVGCSEGQDPKLNHCSTRPYWSTTPVGYFDVDKLDENYFSTLWKTWMPFAVFFESGIATHQAPAGTESNLGSRASGGCVRMHPNFAPIIFKTVQTTGQGLIPVISRNGELKKTAAGDTIRKIGFKTLYIVENEIVR